MTEQPQPKANYYYLAFYVVEKPTYFNAEKPGAAAIQLAQDMYGLPPTDFNSKHGGRFYGWGKYGYTFEVHVKREAAVALETKCISTILNIYE